jgi:hypothetical protein
MQLVVRPCQWDWPKKLVVLKKDLMKKVLFRFCAVLRRTLVCHGGSIGGVKSKLLRLVFPVLLLPVSPVTLGCFHISLCSKYIYGLDL